jgi:hypothetical protein
MLFMTHHAASACAEPNDEKANAHVNSQLVGQSWCFRSNTKSQDKTEASDNIKCSETRHQIMRTNQHLAL